MRRTLANKYKWIPNTRQATSLKFGSDLSDDGEHGDAPVVQLLATLGLRFRVALPVLFGALQGLIYGAGTTRDYSEDYTSGSESRVRTALRS